MTNHNMTQTRLGQTAQRVPGTLLDGLLDRLLAFTHEWRSRRNSERALGHLSNFHLRDVGLTKSDVEAACADNLDRSASRALKSAAQNRMSNW